MKTEDERRMLPAYIQNNLTIISDHPFREEHSFLNLAFSLKK